MAKVMEGMLTGTGKRIALVAGRFNEFITARLIDGAMDALIRHGVGREDITVYRVPGSFEIPPVAKRVAATGNFDGVICLGAVIRGGTPHFDYIAAEVSKGVAQAAMEAGIPILFGVLTTDTIEQAIERAGTKAGNKGFEAAMSLLEMINLYSQIK